MVRQALLHKVEDIIKYINPKEGVLYLINSIWRVIIVADEDIEV